MKFQIYSDLHIEFYKSFPRIQPLCDILILAGDIGSIRHHQFEPFLNYVSENWKKTYYVLGNHEYYGSNHCFYKTQKKYYDFFTKYDNVFLLDREKSILEIENEHEDEDGNIIKKEKICILGCTLWSHANIDSMKYVNCFKKIKYFDIDKNRKINITKDMYNKLHNDEVLWIFSELNTLLENIIERKAFEKTKYIILTHYPMTQKYTSHEKYNNEPQQIKSIFANNIEFDKMLNINAIKSITDNDVKITCISGHTHYSHDFYDNFNILQDDKINFGEKSIKIRFLSNQMGYIQEIKSKETRFNKNGIYEI